MNKTAALIGLGVGIGLLIGVILGGAMAQDNNNQSEQATYTIEPYTGMGSGVLKHGTILKENYKDPASVIGHFNEGTEDQFPGTWIIKKVGDDQK